MKNFINMIAEGQSLVTLMGSYGTQKYFWVKLEMVMCRKGLDIDHASMTFRRAIFPSHMEISKNTGRWIRCYD